MLSFRGTPRAEESLFTFVLNEERFLASLGMTKPVALGRNLLRRFLLGHTVYRAQAEHKVETRNSDNLPSRK